VNSSGVRPRYSDKFDSRLGPLASVHKCTYHRTVAYEWDPAKARRNLLKHGVDFADAVGVFEDACALTIEDPFSQHEQRWISIGMDWLGRVVVVVYTWRGEAVRLISARPATPRERQQYEERR